jgi:glycosyltransferase involved in cell wall biosynthesis
LWNILYQDKYFIRKIVLTLLCFCKRYLILFKIRKYDFVYIHLWTTPLGFPIHEFFVKCLAKKIIFDIDDLIYTGRTSKQNQIIAFLKFPFKSHFLFKNANFVVVSTNELYQYASGFTKSIINIPATINLTPYNCLKISVNEYVTIGWTGSKSTSSFLLQIESVLVKLSQEHVLRFVIMGDNEFSMPGLKNLKIETWSPENEAKVIMQFDIGLHPVPEEIWSLGKSGGKLVQYMAAGVPVVATKNEPNELAVIDGKTGYLVNTNEEWYRKIKDLIINVDLRKHMSRKARERAEEIYSTEINKSKYLQIFEKV